MYYPLVLFDGETDHLMTAALRPGTVHASTGVVAILKRVVGTMRARWPGVTIEVRLDAGGAVPAIDDFCEQAKITSTIGLIPNSRLAALAAPLVEQAQQQRAETEAETVRLIGEVSYQAGSWPQARRVIVKAEASTKGPNTRSVVTTRADPPADLYGWYAARGESEHWIKDLKHACFANRLSDHRFWANPCRLLLHAAAYWRLDTLRRWLIQLREPPLQLDTLRLRLLKIGGRVWQLSDRIRLRLASSHPGQLLWARLAVSRSLRE
jgi:hypothetical protein